MHSQVLRALSQPVESVNLCGLSLMQHFFLLLFCQGMLHRSLNEIGG